MKRIEDSTTLFKVQYALQFVSLGFSPEVHLQLRNAYETGSDIFFYVECSFQSFAFDGFLLLLSPDGMQNSFFPKMQSVMLLAGRMVEDRLEQYNAHKDWRFRGV